MWPTFSIDSTSKNSRKKKYIMHEFHWQPSQYRSTKLKKLWFGSLTLLLSVNVVHFFKIMSNRLMIFMTHFFHCLDIRESKRKISWTISMDDYLKIGAQNRKNYDLDPCNYIKCHVLHFFKIVPNILTIFVTHFFHIFKVKEGDRKRKFPKSWGKRIKVK